LAELASMQEEIQGTRAKSASLQESHAALQAAHAELQEDHSILREELWQLEEKHNEALEQLKESRATVEKVSEGKLIAEERYKHFHGEHQKLSHGLRKAEEKAADYLRQLSFASRVRDAAWADGMYLRFETFWTWWKDPAQRIDFNSVNIKDIPTPVKLSSVFFPLVRRRCQTRLGSVSSITDLLSPRLRLLKVKQQGKCLQQSKLALGLKPSQEVLSKRPYKLSRLLSVYQTPLRLLRRRCRLLFFFFFELMAL
jgi:hypothetical protein